MKPLLQALVSGLLIGGIYALIALGLNIVFGTMRVVNFAQGTLLMAAMFMAYWLYETRGAAPLLVAAHHHSAALRERLRDPARLRVALARA